MCALLKDYEYGTKKGNYWKIIGVYPDTTYRSTNYKVALYESKDSRKRDDSSYVISKMFSIPGITDSREILYNELKKKLEFENYKDI